MKTSKVVIIAAATTIVGTFLAQKSHIAIPGFSK